MHPSFREREIDILEKEIGICTKSPKQSNQKKQSVPPPPLPLSPLVETTMISIPRLPMPYQPGGEPGKGHINYLDSADAMLETEFSPPDRYFAISALLGRLREPMKLPYPPNSLRGAADFTFLTKSKKNEQELEERKHRLALEKQQALILLDKSEMYHLEQQDSTALLALHKKISSHRTAAVFRKPVNPAEAPGYTERIPFPMDLSLIRKLIVARVVKSFSSFHQCVGLICHNCVKFNGRESDYAVITREFEDHVDDKVLEAVRSAASSDAVGSVAATTAAEGNADIGISCAGI
ncbi:hypothetical protein ACHAWU_006935 [Discostella pseudostelligera]|uniref:Bromo domain-containing protein n=1 Tax=Discostella pseudostelligera TaxID=259834 RepID=A0ABD3MY96_9STRA